MWHARQRRQTFCCLTCRCFVRYIPVASVGVWLLHVHRDDFSSLAVFASAHCARSFEVVFWTSQICRRVITTAFMVVLIISPRDETFCSISFLLLSILVLLRFTPFAVTKPSRPPFSAASSTVVCSDHLCICGTAHTAPHPPCTEFSRHLFPMQHPIHKTNLKQTRVRSNLTLSFYRFRGPCGGRIIGREPKSRHRGLRSPIWYTWQNNWRRCRMILSLSSTKSPPPPPQLLRNSQGDVFFHLLLLTNIHTHSHKR